MIDEHPAWNGSTPCLTVRDLTMAVGAFALAKLIEARAGVTESTRAASSLRQPVAA